MLNPKSVDVIIPCFNGEKFIETTIESIISQSFKNINILVVDDGSSDNTPDILKSFGDRITVLKHSHSRNKGAPASMNLGLQNSNSLYVAFLDSDDVFYNKKIERQVAVLSKNNNIGLVYTNGDAVNESGQKLYQLFPDNFEDEQSVEKLLLDNYIRTPSMVMARRELFGITGYFDEKLSHAKDHDMWLKFKEISDFYFIKDPLMGYRQHCAQQSSGRKQWDDGFKLLSNACLRYPYNSKIKRKRLAVLNYRLGVYEIEKNNFIRGFRHLFLSFVHDPYRSLSVAFQSTTKAFLQPHR
jgi:glycosyltransferase involved in cell wall biosynthesis